MDYNLFTISDFPKKKKKSKERGKGRGAEKGKKQKERRREGGGREKKEGGKEGEKKRKPIFIDIIIWDVHFQERYYCCYRAQEAAQINIPLDQSLLNFLSRCTILLLDFQN